MINGNPVTLKAQCGDCKLCCKVLGVPDVTLPGTWCIHCNVHSTKGGCSIYDTRPAPCKEFECGWLTNNGAPELRPDRIHMVVTGESKRLDAYIIHIDPGFPGAADAPRGRMFLEMTMRHGKHKNIVLVTGDKRRVIGDNMGVVLRELERTDNEKR